VQKGDNDGATRTCLTTSPSVLLTGWLQRFPCLRGLPDEPKGVGLPDAAAKKDFL